MVNFLRYEFIIHQSSYLGKPAKKNHLAFYSPIEYVDMSLMRIIPKNSTILFLINIVVSNPVALKSLDKVWIKNKFP